MQHMVTLELIAAIQLPISSIDHSIDLAYISAAARDLEDRWSAICDNRKWKYFNFRPTLFFIDQVDSPVFQNYKSGIDII